VIKQALAFATTLLFFMTSAVAQVTIFNPNDSRISQAIEVGPETVLTYFSGVVPAPANPDANPADREYYGDTETQADSIFERIRDSLEDKGLDFGNVIKMTAFLVGDPDLDGNMDFAGFNRSYDRQFGTAAQPNRPVRSTVQVTALHGPLMFIEIEVVAAHTPVSDNDLVSRDDFGALPTHRYCLTCHGTDGAGNLAIDAPRLAGMERWYLKRQMELFRDGLRGTHPEDLSGREMQPMAVMTDAQLEDILDWVETWEYIPAEITIEGNVERGRQLYRSCATCHGADAEGIEAMNAPALAGQNDWYMVTQLKNFKAGYRGSDPADVYGTQMRVMTAPLADEQAIRDVVSYINTLGR